MSKRLKRAVAFLLLTACSAHPAFAYGLRTGFGKVILEDVPAGREYSMREDSQFPLVIENNSDRAINLKLEVLVPEEGEVQEGYESIPEADWIALEKDSFTVNPHGKAETDVVINVPDSEDYLGRKFHVFIWSYTTGGSVGVGIKSKLLFTVEERAAEQRK